jgi:hypothetical protein
MNKPRSRTLGRTDNRPNVGATAPLALLAATATSFAVAYLVTQFFALETFPDNATLFINDHYQGRFAKSASSFGPLCSYALDSRR